MRKFKLCWFLAVASVVVWLYVSYKVLVGSRDAVKSGEGQGIKFIYQAKKDNSYKIADNVEGDNSAEHRQDGNWTMRDAVIAELKSKYKLNLDFPLEESPWEIAAKWVKPREIHPEYAPELGRYCYVYYMCVTKLYMHEPTRGPGALYRAQEYHCNLVLFFLLNT